jgi:hypothetical protein
MNDYVATNFIKIPKASINCKVNYREHKYLPLGPTYHFSMRESICTIEHLTATNRLYKAMFIETRTKSIWITSQNTTNRDAFWCRLLPSGFLQNTGVIHYYVQKLLYGYTEDMISADIFIVIMFFCLKTCYKKTRQLLWTTLQGKIIYEHSEGGIRKVLARVLSEKGL